MSISLPQILFQATRQVQPLSWPNGSDLGYIRANNNAEIEVTAYDPSPEDGPVTYAVVSGTTILTNLPEYLSLDPNIGHIYGYVPYQPAVVENYTITLIATKHHIYNAADYNFVNTFTLQVLGEVDSTIEWVTDPDLGTVYTGDISELSVVAKQISSGYTMKYQLTAGTLPSGLTLERDGSISGIAINTGSYAFTVLASDVYDLSAIAQTFSLVVNARSIGYTEIYSRPFLPNSQRQMYTDFISNEFTFDPTLIYRYFDPNFGVQTQIRLVLEFSIQQLKLSDYVPAIAENFYKKRIYWGDIKTAIAKDDNGTTIYEVVYVDVIDDQTNNQGKSISKTININSVDYYPASIDNMRDRLQSLKLEDQSVISIRDDGLPRFMRTPQSVNDQPIGYLKVIPLCYALPNQGSKIMSRIRLSGFDFTNLSFEIDRLIVNNSLDHADPRYILFPSRNIN